MKSRGPAGLDNPAASGFLHGDSTSTGAVGDAIAHDVAHITGLASMFPATLA
jgi:hypothetical protein